MSDRTLFEAAAERCIVQHTDALLNDLDRLALRYDVDKETVEAACHRFACSDVADWWSEYVGEAVL